MQLRGLSARTQEAYARAVWQLAQHYHRSPERLSDEELRQYFFYLANTRLLTLRLQTKLYSRRPLAVPSAASDSCSLWKCCRRIARCPHDDDCDTRSRFV